MEPQRLQLRVAARHVDGLDGARQAVEVQRVHAHAAALAALRTLPRERHVRVCLLEHFVSVLEDSAHKLIQVEVDGVPTHQRR